MYMHKVLKIDAGAIKCTDIKTCLRNKHGDIAFSTWANKPDAKEYEYRLTGTKRVAWWAQQWARKADWDKSNPQPDRQTNKAAWDSWATELSDFVKSSH